MGADVSAQAIGFTAYVVWATHPLTWVLGYVVIEGAVRMSSAALTESSFGILPLAAIDACFRWIFRRDGKAAANAAPAGQPSFASAVRERLWTARSPALPDELRTTQSGAEEMLEINASRRKEDWIPPRVVRFQDVYYRLEAFSKTAGHRPFRCTLRKLPAGVPGRNVLIYSEQ